MSDQSSEKTTLDPSACTIRLFPYGSLYFEPSEGASIPSSLVSIHRDFIEDWRAGWFRLGVNKAPIESDSTCRFWQEISSAFLTALCHLPTEIESASIELPDERLLEPVQNLLNRQSLGIRFA